MNKTVGTRALPNGGTVTETRETLAVFDGWKVEHAVNRTSHGDVTESVKVTDMDAAAHWLEWPHVIVNLHDGRVSALVEWAGGCSDGLDTADYAAKLSRAAYMARRLDGLTLDGIRALGKEAA